MNKLFTITTVATSLLITGCTGTDYSNTNQPKKVQVIEIETKQPTLLTCKLFQLGYLESVGSTNDGVSEDSKYALILAGAELNIPGCQPLGEVFGTSEYTEALPKINNIDPDALQKIRCSILARGVDLVARKGVIDFTNDQHRSDIEEVMKYCDF